MLKEKLKESQNLIYLIMVRITSRTISYRPSMLFIDGGYLRANLRELFGSDQINFARLAREIVALWNWGNTASELVRAYYYDAIVDPIENPNKFKQQNTYFDEIRKLDTYEVRLGRLKKTEKRPRQKGVDTLIALDMIIKAFQDHYDIAFLLAGDDDFVDIVQSVKTFTGKRIVGVFFSKHISKGLKECFDYRREIDTQYTNILKKLMKIEKKKSL